MKKISEPVGYRIGKQMIFSSSFDSHCGTQSCLGWSTRGKYNTLTYPDGRNFLNLSVALEAPVPVLEGRVT